ncbi:hypothetical protein M2373_000384 [Chryseobacterium sp. JUb7]|nr:hypothetical protein [Chryseobacterium sp. JUb7]
MSQNITLKIKSYSKNSEYDLLTRIKMVLK